MPIGVDVALYVEPSCARCRLLVPLIDSVYVSLHSNLVANFSNSCLNDSSLFKIKKIDTFNITIEDDFKKLIKINITDFQNFFLVGYATTTHSAHGMSIGEPYTIHEWDRMDQRLKYVALSRSRSIEYINIMK
jgi:hypothetical protein